VARHLAACRAHPGLDLSHQRRHVRLPQRKALLGGQAVDAALDVEDGVDPPHGLSGERGPRDLGQVEQLATPMALRWYSTRCASGTLTSFAQHPASVTGH